MSEAQTCSRRCWQCFHTQSPSLHTIKPALLLPLLLLLGHRCTSRRQQLWPAKQLVKSLIAGRLCWAVCQTKQHPVKHITELAILLLSLDRRCTSMNQQTLRAKQ